MRKLLWLALLPLALATVQAQDEGPDLKVFDEAWTVVKRNFYDKNFNGVDWAAMKEKYRPEAEKCASPREAHAVINRMIAELKASHCVLVEADVYRDHFAPEFSGQATLRCGFELTEIEGEYFVSAVYEKGPAEKAGLKVGDRVLTLNGEPIADSDLRVDAGSDPGVPGHPHFFVRVHAGEDLVLEVRREKKGPKRAVSLTPGKLSLVQASRESIRVIDHHRKKFGYMHQWHYLSSSIATALRDAMGNEFKECDGLVLDVRGRGGSPMVLNQVLSYFRPGRAHRWSKPVVCLVDEGSRSAKEVLAYLWKKEKLGPLVGCKTPGCVLGSTFFKLSDGSHILLAVQNVDMLAGGVKLEGVGVKPDVEVVRDIRYSAGRDLILEKGLDVLRRKCASGPY